MFNQDKRPLRALLIEHELSVSTYDIDFAGHVSNIVYLRWLEDMRRKLFDAHFPLKDFMDQGKTPVLASTEIHYKRPIRLFQRPHGIMWVSDVKKASLIVEAEIFVEGQLTTTARNVGVFVEIESGKAIRVPSICHEKFAMARQACSPRAAVETCVGAETSRSQSLVL